MTTHMHQVVFGRIESECPRCIELVQGAPVRKGWNRMVSRETSASVRADLAAHFRSEKHRQFCGPVCTYGDA